MGHVNHWVKPNITHHSCLWYVYAIQ